MSDQIKRPLREDEQLYFIHVPKCAGTSFISLVDERYVIDEIIPTHYDIKKLKNGITDQQLAGYRFIRGHLPYDLVVPRLPNQPRMITFLREPITRLISNFQMRQRVSDPLVGLQSTLASVTLEEFLDRPDLVRVFANRATRLIGGMDRSGAGKVIPNLERAKERLLNFDVVGIVEHFNDSLELFCYVFDFPPVRTERNLNISPNREARSTISDKTLERIAEVEWADIELYKLGAKVFNEQCAKMRQEMSGRKIKTSKVTRVDSARVDFSRVDPGSGWHVGERYPKYGVVRWTGPETASNIRLPLTQEHSYTVRFGVLRSAAKDILESLTMEVNGHNIPLRKQPGKWVGAVFNGNVPKEILTNQTMAEFSFKVNRTAPLGKVASLIGRIQRIFKSQTQGPDLRFGGLLFNWLEVTANKD